MSKPKKPQAEPAPPPTPNPESTFLKPFAQYHTPTPSDFEREWGRCTFVFDTNVLLNLYRYPKTASDDFLRVLTQLKDRVWIPHHVALEFHTRRRTVIREQIQTFAQTTAALDQVKSKIEEQLQRIASRHYLIKPDEVLPQVTTALDAVRAQLAATEETQKKIVSEDHILHTLASVFDGRVGPDKKVLRDQVAKAAPDRFKAKIPPGYMDGDKSDDTPCLIDGDPFDRRYADLLVWMQLIDHVKEAGITSVILVTDDRKEDWWWHDSTKRPRGPRPELVEELRRAAQAHFFHMYTSDRFVEYAQQHLKTKVEEATLDQIRDIATRIPNKITLDIPRSWGEFRASALQRMMRAAEARIHADAKPDPFNVCDWVIQSSNSILGFVVIDISHYASPQAIDFAVSRVLERVANGTGSTLVHGLKSITVILIADRKLSRSEVIAQLQRVGAQTVTAGAPVRYAIGDYARGVYTRFDYPARDNDLGNLPKPP